MARDQSEMHTLIDPLSEEWPDPLKIGGFTITASAEPYLIAEIGVNHDGKVDQAKRLIDAAHAAGAHAAKFQIFRADTLLTAPARPADYQKAAGLTNQRAMLESLQLSADEFLALCEHCRNQEIEFLATPFGLDDLKLLIDMNVAAIKIASTDINHVVLLDAVIASGLPVLLSTGASEIAEIDSAVSQFDGHEACQRLALMHCVSAYPTPAVDASLSTIGLLARRYGLWVGYSDHTAISTVSGLAVACGAKILEKHITLDCRLSGPDHAFSLTPEQFAEYVDWARQAHEILGEPRQTVFEVERDVRAVARRSIVAGRQIGKGQVITADLLQVKRPAGGIEPVHWQRLLGKKAKRDIATDTQISWDMVE